MQNQHLLGRHTVKGIPVCLPSWGLGRTRGEGGHLH